MACGSPEADNWLPIDFIVTTFPFGFSSYFLLEWTGRVCELQWLPADASETKDWSPSYCRQVRVWEKRWEIANNKKAKYSVNFFFISPLLIDISFRLQKDCSIGFESDWPRWWRNEEKTSTERPEVLISGKYPYRTNHSVLIARFSFVVFLEIVLWSRWSNLIMQTHQSVKCKKTVYTLRQNLLKCTSNRHAVT